MSFVKELIIKAPIIFLGFYACIAFILLYIAFILFERRIKAKEEKYKLSRHKHNPVLKPALHKEWEAVGTFNPAAIKDDEGFVHLLYRAVGADGLSRIGHTKSRDGLRFDTRSPYPVFVSAPTRQPKDKDGKDGPKEYNPNIYTSGGGWGGCEDPRAVVIDGRVYMTYTAFEGWDSVRIGLTSISMEDMKKNRWNWKKPRLISSPSQVNKNWVLFPEKINGKIAVLHSVSPKVKIDYLDEMYSDDSGHIKSTPPSGGRPEYWDNWVRGAGPPPVKTDIGWLLLYHAMDKADPNKYKLGAMILDAKDPTRVLYRSHEPILEPDMPYENDWKPGVIYASGALIIGDDLVVYYGGGDKYICVAKTPLKELLDWIVAYGKI